jgi:hypothetical protein
MFHDLSLLLIALLIVWLAGAFVLFMAFDNTLSFPEFAGFSYIIGSGIVWLLLYLSYLIGGYFSTVYVYVFIFLSATMSLVMLVKGKSFKLKDCGFEHKPLQYYEYLLILLIIFIIVAIVSEGIFGEPGWDAVFTYGFVAKSFFIANKMNLGFFTDATRYGYVHLDYPFLFSLLIYWSYRLIGTDNNQLIQLITIGYYIALAGIFYGSIRDWVFRLIALLSLTTILYNPAILYDTVRGEADIIVAVYLLSVLILYSKLRQSPSIKMALMLGIVTGFLANTKNEGFVYFILFSLVILFTSSVPWRARVSYFIPSALFSLPWFVTKLMYGIRSDLFINIAHWNMIITDRLSVLFVYYYYFFTGKSLLTFGTGLLWLILLIGFIITLTYNPVKQKFLNLWLPFILLFLVYSLVYLVTPHGTAWQLGYSIPRTMSHFIPSLLWLSTVVIGERYINPGREKKLF